MLRRPRLSLSQQGSLDAAKWNPGIWPFPLPWIRSALSRLHPTERCGQSTRRRAMKERTIKIGVGSVEEATREAIKAWHQADRSETQGTHN
jgi:hypothetical protein